MPLGELGVNACHVLTLLAIDTSFINRLRHQSLTFRISEYFFLEKKSDLVDVDAGVSRAFVDFVLVHCNTHTCYKIVKNVRHKLMLLI